VETGNEGGGGGGAQWGGEGGEEVVCATKPEYLARRVQLDVRKAETGKLGGEELACAQIVLNGSRGRGAGG